MESYEVIWKQALNELANSCSSISYSTYIEILVPVDYNGNKLVLCCPSDYFAQEVGNRLADKVRAALEHTNSGITDFELFVGESKDDYLNQLNSTGNAPELANTPIDPKMTFDSFVEGPSNEFIVAAAKAVANNPGEAYNPLFIYGGTGLGKTHILMAIANYLKIHNPRLKVVYAPSEQFTNQLIESISRGKNNGAMFRNKYRNVDVLLLDDVQFIAKKELVQTEFFNTFNELVMQNKQIVLTSDRPPKEIEFLEERLRTRFEGGLIADVQVPETETKIAILKRKAEEKKCIIDIKVLTYIAENSDDDVRSLIGKLTRIIFSAQLQDKPVTIELAKETLKDSQEVTAEEVQVEDIINCVCDYYKISKQNLLSKKKNKEFVDPRQVCIYLITELLNLPLVTVGQKMGGRDHSTVIYARDKVAELIKTNTRFAIEVNDVKNMILKK